MKFRFAVFCAALLFVPKESFAQIVLKVNTTNDEFGENSATCSLREAIEAVNTRSAFGGCISGERFGTNLILLENKEYVLTRGELTPKQPMTITGFSANDLVDTLTKLKPKRQTPSTIINAQNKHRIFNTSLDKPALTLQHLKLMNGFDNDKGGAILSGGSVVLSNVNLEKNFAQNAGGAIYLLGATSKLVSNDSAWLNNQVGNNSLGAAFAMSCLGDLKFVDRSISIKRSTFAYNGNTNAESIIEGCGILSLDMERSTIGENTAKISGGIINLVNNISTASTISMDHMTMVQNNTAPILHYAEINKVILNSSILAFNNTTNSCVGNSNTTRYVGNFNLFENCAVLNQASTTQYNHSNDRHLATNETTFAAQLNPLANYGGYTITYLPKANTSQYIINGNVSETCADVIDQRGSSRPTFATDKCDLGSVERRIALAIVDTSTSAYTNQSDTDRITLLSVLQNDIPSETDLTDDIDNARGNFSKDAQGNYLISLSSNTKGFCSIIQPTTADELPKIKFDNKGQILSDTQREDCKYTFIDSNGNTSSEGQLFFRTVNKAPIAVDDGYLLESGTSSLDMDVVKNDSDSADGKYGELCTSNTIKCNGGYYIRIASSPSLGVIEGDSRECPDYNDTNKYKCYRGSLKYFPKNTLSSFNDSFTYVIYDNDLAVSEPATVTIINQTAINAQDTGGSLAWWSILSLTGLAVYRRRKSRIA